MLNFMSSGWLLIDSNAVETMVDISSFVTVNHVKNLQIINTTDARRLAYGIRRRGKIPSLPLEKFSGG